MSQLVRKAYELYFGCKVRDQDKVWALKICCSSWTGTLAGWLKGTHKSMPFAVLMLWREPQVHLNDCYFCMTKINGFSRCSKHKTEYHNIPSAVRRIPHDDSKPLPKTPESYTLDSDSESEDNKKLATPFRNNTINRMWHILLEWISQKYIYLHCISSSL
jgi:hypothetical protein